MRECLDPSRPGVVVGRYRRARREDVLRAVECARSDRGGWRALSFRERSEILACVAKNPKTAVPFATRLIDKLRTSDLRVMAKMQSGMREVLRKAALREYLRRTSR